MGRPPRIEPRVVAGGLSLLATTVALAGTGWALHVARGVSLSVGGSGTSDGTEFISGSVYVLTALVATGLVGVAAFVRWPVALAGTFGVLAALVWGASVAVQRYHHSDWGTGPSRFVYAVPVIAAAVGLALVIVAGAARRPGSTA